MARLMVWVVSLLFFSTGSHALEASSSFDFNTTVIQNVTGVNGQWDRQQKTFKIILPRDDLKIVINGMPVTPAMGLSSWITFKKSNDQTSLVGDLVLLQEQVNPVMSVALGNGLQVTALHNPFLWDFPRVLLMHIQGQGEERVLAKALRQVLEKIKTTSDGGGDFPFGNGEYVKTTLDPGQLDSIFGEKGSLKEGIYKVVFSQETKKNDREINKDMLANTWVAFAGSDEEAIMSGTLVAHESGLQKTLLALRNAKIYVVAIYSHAINDNPNYVFIHFWGIGKSQLLAKSLRAALLVAQSNTLKNAESIVRILPAELPLPAETLAGDVLPVELSLIQKDSCSYTKKLAKELYPALAVMQNNDLKNVKQANLGWILGFLSQKEKMIESIKSLTRVASNVLIAAEDKISEAASQYVHASPPAGLMTYPETAELMLPSAKRLFAGLSLVKNNTVENTATSSFVDLAVIKNSLYQIAGSVKRLSDSIIEMMKKEEISLLAIANKMVDITDQSSKAWFAAVPLRPIEQNKTVAINRPSAIALLARLPVVQSNTPSVTKLYKDSALVAL